MKKILILLLILIGITSCEKNTEPTDKVVQKISLIKPDDDYFYHFDRYDDRHIQILDSKESKPCYRLITIVFTDKDSIQMSDDYGTYKEISKLKCTRYSEANKKLIDLKKLKNLNCK